MVLHARLCPPARNTRAGRTGLAERREARDRTLAVPALILPALQVNLRAGALPDRAANGIRYLRIPLDQF